MIHVIGSDHFSGVLLEYLFLPLLPYILTQTSAFSAFYIFRTGSSLVTCQFVVILRRHKADFNLLVYVTHGRRAKQHKNVAIWRPGSDAQRQATFAVHLWTGRQI